MAGLQVEWVSFSAARETIIEEMSQQLSDDAASTPPSPSPSPGGSRGRQLLDRTFLAVCMLLVPAEYRYDFTCNLETFEVLILPPLFCVVCLIIASAVDMFDIFTLCPAIVTMAVLLVAVMVNVIVTLRYHKASRCEIKDQVCGILEHYVDTIDSQSTKSRVGSFLQNPNSSSCDDSVKPKTTKTELNSGHSHVNIVSVYREEEWQRLPALLLVKGDIISLMAGDKTPGRVFELIPEPPPFHIPTSKRPPSVGPGSKMGSSTRRILTGWKLGQMISGGDKIFLRDERKKYSSSTSAPSSNFVCTNEVLGGESSNSHLSVEKIPHIEQARSLDSSKRCSSNSMGSNVATGSGSGDGKSKHSRSINSESVELLTLHSDMRCFVMDETPIKAFCESLLCTVADTSKSSLNSNAVGDEEVAPSKNVYIPHQDGRKDIENGMSYLRQQFIYLHSKSISYCLLWVLVVAFCAILRLILVQQYGTQDEGLSTLGWAIFIPFVNIIMVFLPVSLPLGLIIVEALTTANILATSEALLQYGSENAGRSNLDRSSHDSVSNEGEGGRKGLKSHSGFFKRKYLNIGGAGKGVNNDEDDFSDDSDNDHVDEYQDEDIDDRVGKAADYARYNVDTKRQWEYFQRVLHVRLNRPKLSLHRGNRTKDGVTKKMSVMRKGKAKAYTSLSSNVSGEGTNVSSKRDPLLPIPLVRTKLIETLGAVTMVCFVDDDIVCESFSMCEEIYLLRNHEQESSQNPSQITASSAIPPLQAPERGTSNSNNHGVVLDLHANSQAKGSRFENPKWFLHLPSLKPIGMNAMLAYKNSIALPKQLTTSNVSLLPEAPITLKNEAGDTKLRNDDVAKQYPYTYAHPPTKSNAYPSIPSFTSPQLSSGDEGTDSSANIGNKVQPQPFHISTAQRSLAEKNLIKHCKSQGPLECLRELAEEIGFEESDVEYLKSLVEVSVLAPGLGDIRLVEDTHAWSQEQTRKRGSFEPHILGNIVEDSAKGSLQLMAQGSPPLLLSYCREYWDGSNISPLTSNDRKELFAIFERWDLEDFDVIAFGYSPVPLSVKKILQPLVALNSDKHGEEINSLTASPKNSLSKRQNSTKSTSSNVSERTASTILSSLLPPSARRNLVYVDPCSEAELKLAGNKVVARDRLPSKSEDVESKSASQEKVIATIQTDLKQRNAESVQVEKVEKKSLVVETQPTEAVTSFSGKVVESTHKDDEKNKFVPLPLNRLNLSVVEKGNEEARTISTTSPLSEVSLSLSLSVVSLSSLSLSQ